MSPKSPISEKGLEEILGAFASEGAVLPSVHVLKELAAATGKTVATVKEIYGQKYRELGGEDDPWEPPAPC